MFKAIVSLLLVAAFALFAPIGSASPEVAVYAATDYSALAPPGSEQASAKVSPLTAIDQLFGTEPPASAGTAYSSHHAAAPQRQDFP